MVATLSSNYLGYFHSKYTAQEIEDAIDNIKRKPKSNRCENCGAPLNEYGGCDYCGTGKQSKVEPPRYKYQFHGRDMLDGDAVVVFNGSFYRCRLTRAACVDMGFAAERTADGRLVRDDAMQCKYVFQVVQE